MYVAPAGRSRGVARALLGALEDAARELRLRPRAARHRAAAAARARAVPVRRLPRDPRLQRQPGRRRSGARRSSRAAAGSPSTTATAATAARQARPSGPRRARPGRASPTSVAGVGGEDVQRREAGGRAPRPTPSGRHSSVDAELLAGLARGRLERRLAAVQPAARQLPERAVAVGVADEEDPPLVPQHALDALRRRPARTRHQTCSSRYATR